MIKIEYDVIGNNIKLIIFFLNSNIYILQHSLLSINYNGCFDNSLFSFKKKKSLDFLLIEWIGEFMS